MSVKKIYDWYAKEGYLTALNNGNLTLYNYTAQCVFKGNWNFHTRNSRGLILDTDGNYIARPFTKFFSLDERIETYQKNLPQEEAEIAEKYDGSLIIIFWNPDSKKWDAVTRGSWDNDQTRYAKKWLKSNDSKLEFGYTYCFELIAPWNRLVIYYPNEDMILIGRIDIHGNDSSYADTFDYAKNHELSSIKFFRGWVKDIVLSEIPEDKEGYVARFDSGLRVKIKSPSYVERHRDV